MNRLRAPYGAVIARYTIPGGIALKNFFLEPGGDHRKKRPWGVIHILTGGARASTRATLNTIQQVAISWGVFDDLFEKRFLPAPFLSWRNAYG